MTARQSAEHVRLAESPESSSPWRLWGPYLSGRQWGTVREDYSANGDAWSYLPFEQAHQRAYRWGEDGLGGICDRYGFLNFSVALWNGHDRVLKERYFGLTNAEGNHGEDIKEYWWALDGTPTHSWMRWLYRYPQAEFPYDRLRSENAARGRDDREFELADTGILDGNRFFDVTVELREGRAGRRGDRHRGDQPRPRRRTAAPAAADLVPQHLGVGTRRRAVPNCAASTRRNASRRTCASSSASTTTWAATCSPPKARPTSSSARTRRTRRRCSAVPNPTQYTKDGIDARVVHGDESAVNPAGAGTKAALWYRFDSVAPGASVTVRLRLSMADPDDHTFGPAFAAVLTDRAAEADEFYAAVLPSHLSEAGRDSRAAGVRRAAVEQAALPVHRQRVAGG